MKKDIQPLIDKAEKSLSAAEILFDQGYHDFAASRAYYAMFYVAEALLAHIGGAYSTHGGVIGAFGREFAKSGKLDSKFHRWLIDGQDIRNVGDYGIDVEISKEQVRELLVQAGEFIRAGRNYLQSSETGNN